MDLVKIGFLVKADGLKDANTQVDALLTRVDSIGTKGKKAASDFESSQKKTKDSVKKTGEEVDKTTKALERQRIIGEYLGKGLDKTTASAIASFRQLGGTTAQVNALMSSLASNKSLVQAQKDTTKLAREQIEQQQKALDDAEKARQKRFAGEQNQYQKNMELLSREVAARKVAQQKVIDDEEKARQQKFASAQKYYQQQMELLNKQTLAQRTAAQKTIDDAEKARQKRMAAVQNEYQKNMELLARQTASQKAAAQKVIDDAEKARVKRFSAEQQHYQKNMELLARQTAAQRAAEEKAAQNAEKERQKQIAAAERARQAELRGQVTPSTGSGTFDQIKGIAAYALLSTAIYGAMTATFGLIAATIKMADEYTSTQQRLKLYIKDAQTLGEVNTFLAKSAIQNNVGLRENAALYAKLAPAMQRIGANTAATNQVVDAFGKSLRIGGATVMEATSATIQFAQAMASGKLAGDEFRSISEASPRFLKAIADGSGIAAQKLKEMSSAGALTTEVIARALVKEYHNLSLESESLGYTLEQGTNALKTGFMSLIGEFNEGAGITKYLGELMADMGVSMIDDAKSAKESGEAFKAWATGNAENIDNLVEAFKLLSTVIITRYIVAMVLARAESLKLAYQTSALAAAQTASMRSFVLGATAVTAFGRAAQTAFTFMGGWAGILLTIAGVAATYLVLRDNSAEATQKLVEQSKYVDITTEAYQRLNKEQQLNARSSIVNDLNDTNKKLDEQAAAVENVLKSYAMSRQFSGLGLDKGTKEIINGVTQGVLSYDTALRLLSENKNVPKNIVEDFKKEKDIYNETAKSAITFSDAAKIVGVNTEIAGNKAQNATPLIKGLSDQSSELGDNVEIAGSKLSKFTTDLKKVIQDSKDTYDLMQKFDLDEAYAKKLVDRVNEKFAGTQGAIDKAVEKIESAQKLINKLDATDPQRKSLQVIVDKAKETLELNKKLGETKKKYYAEVDAPLVKQAQEEAARVNALTQSRAEQKRKDKKDKKDELRDLEKFNKQLLEISTYQKMLEQVTDLDVARIASQKEYIDIYKDNLSVAEKIAEIQLSNKQAEARLEYSKSLKEQVSQLSNIAELTKAGADYETAKSLAAANFSNDAIGREAAEKAITNALLGQSYALSDQITEQETLNQYLREGMGIEEARFKVALSRIAKLSGGKNIFDEFGEQYEDSMKILRVKKATEASEIKINSLVRESNILTKAIAIGYTAANVAVAKLAGATTGLIFSQAEMQQKQQEENDLLNERIKNQLSLNSLLSGESETLRDVKNTYLFITDEEAKRIEANRKLVTLAEVYASKMEQQKTLPIGDFSNVNFDVFGDIGNPFKEALDGLNAFISGNTKLTESLSIVAEQIQSLKSQAFVEEMFGNTDAANALTKQIEGQVNLEKDLQKQKEETNDIAYGQGLKLAKAFFKEGSKGYKVVSALEMALQAKKIAFAIWEKKDDAMKLASKLAGYAKDMVAFIAGVTTKIGAQMGLNVVEAQGAVASAANAPPPVGFASAAAMIALLAGIGIAISGSAGSSSSFEPTNEGVGTVFGDSEAQSESIKNSIELLSDNSDLMLPLTSAMLTSLRNIESSIGGVTNLIVRGATGKGFNVSEGFTQNSIGSFLEKAGNTFFAGIGDFLGINKMLGGFLGGLFGKKTTVQGQGLFGGAQSLSAIMQNGFNLQEYVDVQTKKKTLGVTTSTKNSTQYSAASQELENQFGLIFTGFYDSIVSATGALSANTDEVKKQLQAAIINIGKIDLKGLNGEQIQERLEAVFGAAADSLAQQGFKGLDAFQKVGEGYYETLMRVASSVEQASYFTERLNVKAIKYTDILNKQGDVAAEIVRQSVLLVEGNKNIKGGFYDLVNTFSGTAEELTSFVLQLRDLQDQLLMTGKNADYLTSSMILGAGGLDKLSSGLDAYFEMLSPAEQAAELTRRLTKEFAIFGKELPADVKAFRNLVNGIDVSTEAGQKLYGQIIALAPEFNDLQDALESANSETNALVQSLRDLAEQARAARGETEQPRNLEYLRNEFQNASKLALQGDTEAAARVVSLGKDLMQISKLYSTTGADYAKDLAFIQGIATTVADLQAKGLGTTVTNTSLTPSTSTTTTPTIETTNSSMQTEMKAMREEFNAGILAVAKFVQKLDSRTERWDDGNRMMVGIITESDDTPVKVVT
jgi:tape measure domain-containing protein